MKEESVTYRIVQKIVKVVMENQLYFWTKHTFIRSGKDKIGHSLSQPYNGFFPDTDHIIVMIGILC